MSSRTVLARLRRIQQQLPPLPRAECVNHATLCPLGSPTGAWRGGLDVIRAYTARHGVDLRSLPCHPGDPVDAVRRLAQAGVVDAGVIHVIEGVDLDVLA